MKVFGPPKSTNVARLLVCLEEVGAEYEIVPIDFFGGEHKSPAHVARNPFGQIPAFQDDDFVFFGEFCLSWLINLLNLVQSAWYILWKYKSDLLPDEDLKKATLVDIWLDVEYGQCFMPISLIILNIIFKPMMGSTCDQQQVDEKLEKLKKIFEVFEAQLSKCKYLAGDFISLADLTHCPSLYYFMETEYGSLLDSYPHVKAWCETLMSRPSVKRMIELMSD